MENRWCDFVASSRLIHRRQVPTLQSATPTASSERGEVSVTIAGQGFVNLPTLACRFGLVIRPAQFISSELILCSTPPESEPNTVHLEVTLNGIDYTAQGLQHAFLPVATLRRVTPEASLVAGGTTVVIEGSGFAEFAREGVRVNCQWEIPGSQPRDVLETRAKILTDANMTCVSPPAEQPGLAWLSILADGIEIADQEKPLSVEYELAATIVELFPAHGTPAGGTRINVTGKGFVDGGGLTCRFRSASAGSARPERHPGTEGGIVADVSAVFVAPSMVQCSSPALTELHFDEDDDTNMGHVFVDVSNRGWDSGVYDDANRGLSFWYRPQTKVNVICPCFLTLRCCSEFALPSYCLACGRGSFAARLRYDNRCTTLTHQTRKQLDCALIYAPQVSSLTPVSASSERDTIIHITGDIFLPSDVLGCRIGDTLISATFLSPSIISCTYSGRSEPGPVEISVTDNGVDFAAAGIITFLPASTITRLAPSSGPLSGGIAVILEGTGFSTVDTPSCAFGGTLAAAEVLSATTAECITPPLSSSLLTTAVSVPVFFSNNGFDLDVVDQGMSFLFYPDPVILSVTPAGGVTNGSAVTVIMSGSNFAPNLSAGGPFSDYQFHCRLGDSDQLENGMVVSSAEAICLIACGSFSGRARVEVSLNGGSHWTASNAAFRCDPLPVVESIWPSVGLTSGGTPLTVRGFGFVSSPSLSCLVGAGSGGIPTIRATWVSTSTVECLTPSAVTGTGGPGNASVSVSNDGFHFSKPVNGAIFAYMPSPTVVRVRPTFASVAGSSIPLTVSGTNFADYSSAACRFTPLATTEDGAATGLVMEKHPAAIVNLRFLSDTTVLCPVPRQALPPGPTVLTVSVNGVDFDERWSAKVELEALPEVTNVVPSKIVAGPAETPVEVSASNVRAAPKFWPFRAPFSPLSTVVPNRRSRAELTRNEYLSGLN